MRRIPLFAAFILGLLGTPSAAQLRLVPLDIRTPIPPTPLVADGQTHLVYELRITNVGSQTLTLAGVEVLAPDQTVLTRLTGEEIKGSARLAGSPSGGADARTLPSGRQTLLYLWIAVPGSKAVPVRLTHRIEVETQDSAQNVKRDTLDRYVVPVVSSPAIVVSAPFTGGPWVAVNGPSNKSGHRRTAVPIEGEAQIGQRFATDWIKLGTDGLAFHGDSLVNANWYGYGSPVVAVADGIVSETKDSIIENVPFSPTMAVPITLETVGGNHVILDLGAGKFAFYAHLQPGSLKVKLGDRVKKGQVVGLLGNSGNSTAPHLHFHITNGNSPLGSEGLPFAFDRFELLDWPKEGFESMLKGWHASGPAALKSREGTLENMIVRFP